MIIIPTTYFEQPHPLQLGQYFEGGLVGYVEGDFPNQRAIIVSVDWAGERKWGTTGVDVVGTSDALFSGSVNTDLIIATEPTFDSAAKLAKNYTYNGFSGWCLPSKNDLIVICANKSYLGSINWVSNNGTWTSTQSNTSYAWWQNIRDGASCGSSNITYTKNANLNVRPVRYVTYTPNQQQY